MKYKLIHLLCVITAIGIFNISNALWSNTPPTISSVSVNITLLPVADTETGGAHVTDLDIKAIQADLISISRIIAAVP